MTKLFLVLIFAFTSSSAYSVEVDCEKLDASAQSLGTAVEASVIGNDRAYLHSAPNIQCKFDKVFVVPGDYLTAYNEYKGWLYVKFINKNGDDFSGWVLENRLQIHGKYGR